VAVDSTNSILFLFMIIILGAFLLYYIYIYIPQCMCVYSVAKSCPALCDPMDCDLPGSSVLGISQARISYNMMMLSLSD